MVTTAMATVTAMATAMVMVAIIPASTEKTNKNNVFKYSSDRR